MRGVRTRTIVSAAAACAVVGATAIPAGAADGWTQVAGGLAGPLGLAVGDEGSIYVAELFGGALTVIRPGAEPATLVEGPIGGGVDATGRGNVVYTQSGPPEFGGSPVATLNSLRGGKSADIKAFEVANDPDGEVLYGVLDPSEACAAAAAPLEPIIGPLAQPGDVNPNPYAVAIDTDGTKVVADAGGNGLLRVSANGRSVQLITLLPPVVQELTADVIAGLIEQINGELPPDVDPLPADALDACVGEDYSGHPVPTDVEIGPDGNYYVSSLPGFPEQDGGVFRVNRWSNAVTRIASGLHGAVDLAVASDGTIYVAELFGGSIAVIEAGVVVDRIPLATPGAVEVRGGTLYATSGVFGPPGSTGSVVMRTL
jgi:hypothetical protein